VNTELKPRQLKEVMQLLQAGDSLPLSRLFTNLDLKIKERTLRSDLQAVISYCAPYGIKIRRKKDCLFVMASHETRTAVEAEVRGLLAEQLHMNSRERRRHITSRCLLLPAIPTLDQWSEELGVSRPSIVRDIKAVKEWLRERNLCLTGKTGVGYTLLYQEFDWRNAVVKFLLPGNENRIKKRIAANEHKEPWDEFAMFYSDFDFTPVNQFIDHLENRTKTRVTEPDRLALILYIGLMVIRSRLGKKVTPKLEQLEPVQKSNEYQVVKEEIPLLEKTYAAELSPDEMSYLALSYLCAKKTVPRQTASLPDFAVEAKKIALMIASETEELFCIPLKKDEIFVRLLTNHITIILQKLQFGLPLEAIDVEYFKNQHPVEYGLGLRFCDIVRDRINIHVPDVEAVFIAMHIAAGLERQKHSIYRRKRIALVCTTALSASTFLFWQLSNLFPQVDVVDIGSYDDIVAGRISSEIDLIVSTVPLDGVRIPHVVISPMLTREDKKNILLFLEEKPGSVPGINNVGDLLIPETIFLGADHSETDGLLRNIGFCMVKMGYAKSGYVKGLLDHEKRFGSGMAMPYPLALPHAKPVFTRKTNVAVITLKKPLPFRIIGSDGTITTRLVIMPLLNFNDAAGVQFYELLSMLKNKKIAAAICQCKTPDQVIRLFTSNSQKN